MKKIFGILALALSFVACDNDVVFNDPSFGAQRLASLNDSIAVSTYENWSATDFSAKILDGALILTGKDSLTTVELHTASFQYGAKYDLGVIEDNRGILSLKRNELDESPSLYVTGENIGSGYIVFAPKEQQVEGTITGEFYVTFEDTMLVELGGLGNYSKDVTYSKGRFYRIPLETAK